MKSVAEELIATLGKPVSNKTVKAALVRAALPLATKRDTYENADAGISYSIEKLDVGPRHASVPAVNELEFRGPFPAGLARGATRAQVQAVLGAPASRDVWFEASGNIQITASFARGKLASLTYTVVAGALDDRYADAGE